MRANPGLDIATAITELAVGEALVSLLDDKARPSVTQRVFVLPPAVRSAPSRPRSVRAFAGAVAGQRRVRKNRGPRIGLRTIEGPRQRRPDPKPTRIRTGSIREEANRVLKGETAERGLSAAPSKVVAGWVMRLMRLAT